MSRLKSQMLLPGCKSHMLMTGQTLLKPPCSSQSLDGLNNMIGITSAVASTVAPVTAVVGLSAVFIRWIAEIYKQT